MKESPNHLSRDLKALHYLDAVNAGDLEAVAFFWEEAGHDPELERMLTELDGALFAEAVGGQSPLPQQRGRRRLRRVVWVGVAGAAAAACLLAVQTWLGRDGTNAVRPPESRSRRDVAVRPAGAADRISPLLEARRNVDAAEMPAFIWPLDNTLSTSTPLDALD